MIRGSNPNMGNDKFVFERYYLLIAIQKKTKTKKKRPGTVRRLEVKHSVNLR